MLVIEHWSYCQIVLAVQWFPKQHQSQLVVQQSLSQLEGAVQKLYRKEATSAQICLAVFSAELKKQFSGIGKFTPIKQ